MQVEIPSKTRINSLIEEKFNIEFKKVWKHIDRLREDVIKLEEEVKILHERRKK